MSANTLDRILTPATAFARLPEQTQAALIALARAAAEQSGLPLTDLREAAASLAYGRMTEADRVAIVKAAAARPPNASPAIPEAPARGPVDTFEPLETVTGADGAPVVRRSAPRNALPVKVRDAFDRMAVACAAHGKPHPLSPGQIAMGRHYALLIERHAGGGVRGSSMETVSGGAGGSSGYIDARIAQGRAIDTLTARIGPGIAKAIRRVRPSTAGTKRLITDLDLVRHVCIAGRTPSEVLAHFGWTYNSRICQDLTEALGAALDRMQGPVDRKTAHCGTRPQHPFRAL